MTNKISVIGLGKLGASMAAVFASRGFDVIGVDVNRAAVDAVNSGKAPVQETGLEQMIEANRGRLRATMDHSAAIKGSDVSFVIVPTPSDSRGAFSLEYASYAFQDIGRALKAKDRYHVVVLTSTVLPGSTRQVFLPLLESTSGRKCGADFGLCYSPEFIALGTVIRDLMNPDLFLVGEFDKKSGDILEAVNKRICVNQALCRRMSIENAELAKIALNSFITLKISFANMLADICERIPGGNVDVVSDAVGMDSRVGRKYLTGGLGFGGPCFPRDNVALSYIGRELGASCELIEANDRYNRSLAPRIVEKLKPVIRSGATVAVLGMAYKPLSHVIEESAGICLAKMLSSEGYRVVGYDPLAGDAARTALSYEALVSNSVEECLKDAEAVLITTTDGEFRSLEVKDFRGCKPGVLVVDFWRCLESRLKGVQGINYFPIGECRSDDEASAVLRKIWSAS